MNALGTKDQSHLAHKSGSIPLDWGENAVPFFIVGLLPSSFSTVYQLVRISVDIEYHSAPAAQSFSAIA